MTLMKESSSEKRKNVNRPQDILMSFKRRKAEENDDIPEETEKDDYLYKPWNVSESDDDKMDWDVNSFSALTSSCNTEKIEEERPRTPNFDNEENLDLDYRNLNNPDYETRNHINSYNPAISHYRRKHAPLRHYLPSELNASMMFLDFKLNNPVMKVRFNSYWRQIRKHNISFAKLGEEECEICLEQTHHRNRKEIRYDALNVSDLMNTLLNDVVSIKCMQQVH